MNFIIILFFLIIYTFIILDLGCNILVYSLAHCSDNVYEEAIKKLNEVRKENSNAN